MLLTSSIYVNSEENLKVLEKFIPSVGAKCEEYKIKISKKIKELLDKNNIKYDHTKFLKYILSGDENNYDHCMQNASLLNDSEIKITKEIPAFINLTTCIEQKELIEQVIFDKIKQAKQRKQTKKIPSPKETINILPDAM